MPECIISVKYIYFINSSHFQIIVIQFQYLFQFHVRVSMWNYLVSTTCHNGAEAKSLLLTIAKSSTDLEGGPGGGVHPLPPSWKIQTHIVPGPPPMTNTVIPWTIRWTPSP